MSNIINHEQWGKMNDYLHNIAVSLGSNIDTSTWAGVQKAVRLGFAPELFPVGTQLKVNHSVYGERLYDVVAHDYLKGAKDKNAHTMTLLCHDSIGQVQFDGAEAFYYAETELPAGTYNFTITGASPTWMAGTYYFTLTKNLPKGGQLSISGTVDSIITTLSVRAYASRTTTEVSETVAITSGSVGTNLGTLGQGLNHSTRVSFGSNNYKESAIRQFLNSSADVGGVWTPQTKFDRPPTWVTSKSGFMNGFDEDFLAVVGEVIVPCATNDNYESPDSTTNFTPLMGAKYTVTDKFYLVSQNEIFGNHSNVITDDSILLPYYEGATDVDRIKLDFSGLGGSWLTRSSVRWSANLVRCVLDNGSSDNAYGTNAYGCVPAFTIL